MMIRISNMNSLPLLKRLGFYSLLCLLALIAIYAIGRPIQLWMDTFYTGNRVPYLQMPAPNAMTLRWQTQPADVGVIRYGLQPDQLTLTSQDEKPIEEHEIRLTQLKPGTRYYYSIGNQKSIHYSGLDYWFITPHANGENTSVRFVVLGDPGYAGKNQANVRDAVISWLQSNPRTNKSPEIDLLFTTGDNAYRSGTNKQYEKDFFESYAQILRNTAVWPVHGNHDARRRTYFNIFSLPTAAESGGTPSGTEHFFSLDYNLVHFVILDTEDSDLSENSPMLRWLKQDLASNKQRWTIALFHHPPYTKGSHDSDDKSDSNGRLFLVRENILPVLEQGGVDLVLSGHSHAYERSHLLNCHYAKSDQLKPDMLHLPEINNEKSEYKKPVNRKDNTGTIYTVIGSSSKLSSSAEQHPVMAVTRRMLGSLVFDIDIKRLSGYFISDRNETMDAFSISKTEDSVPSFNATCSNNL